MVFLVPFMTVVESMRLGTVDSLSLEMYESLLYGAHTTHGIYLGMGGSGTWSPVSDFVSVSGCPHRQSADAHLTA